MPITYTHHALSVDEAKKMIEIAEKAEDKIEVIDCDHDLGDYAAYGGDGIKLLDWLLERDTLYPVKLHTANPVGRAKCKECWIDIGIKNLWRKTTLCLKKSLKQ